MGRLHPLSRELYIILQNLAFTLFMLTVLLGTVFPLVMEAWDGTRLSIGQPYFDRMTLPIGLLIIALMGLGPAVPWGRMKTDKVGQRLLVPLVIGALSGVATIPLVGFAPYTAFAVGLCTWALLLNVSEFITPVRARMANKSESLAVATVTAFRQAHRRYGAHIAHIGVIVVVLGITASKGFQVSAEVTLTPGQSVTVGQYEATFTGAEEVTEAHRKAVVATVLVRQNGRDVGVLEPRLNFYPRMREPIGTPDVRPGITNDLYLSLLSVAPDNSYVSLRVMRTPLVSWIWFGTLVIAFGTLISMWPARRRKQKAAA